MDVGVPTCLETLSLFYSKLVGALCIGDEISNYNEMESVYTNYL
jgi:hypothetical protein